MYNRDDLSGETLEVVMDRGKVTWDFILKALGKAFEKMKQDSYMGEQSIRKFNRSNLQTQSVDTLENEDIKAMRADLKQFNVDFSVVQNRESGVNTLYFRAKDLDIINKAFENLIEKGIKKSIPEQLREFKKRAAAQRDERQHDRAQNPNKSKDMGMDR